MGMWTGLLAAYAVALITIAVIMLATSMAGRRRQLRDEAETPRLRRVPDDSEGRRRAA